MNQILSLDPLRASPPAREIAKTTHTHTKNHLPGGSSPRVDPSAAEQSAAEAHAVRRAAHAQRTLPRDATLVGVVRKRDVEDFVRVNPTENTNSLLK